jgi:multidrug efflux pump subunit AcrA (membrane-fusion protein)
MQMLTLQALQHVHTPRMVRRFAWLVVLVFLALPFLLLFVPWQQTISGTGRVIDFDPNLRQQVIAAPIDGRIDTWYVWETKEVSKGDKIVDLSDIDPLFVTRLKSQRDSIVNQKEAARKRVTAFEEVIREQMEARDALLAAQRDAIKATELALEAAKKTVDGAQADAKFGRENAKLVDLMVRSPFGLSPEQEKWRADAVRDKLDADLKRAQAGVSQAEANLGTAKAQLLRIESDENAKIQNSRASQQTAVAEIEAAEARLQEIDVRIRRQEEQHVKSPCDGWIYRVEANAGAGGQVVKQTEVLASIVPKMEDPCVELFIEGNDAPLIVPNQATGLFPRVRIQFEGWPAVQFMGWPSAARGTFGGRIVMMDATDDGKGRFRVLVKPEKHFEADCDPVTGSIWPEGRFLRQGNKANGWVMIEAEGAYAPMVPTGWELWRRLNGFPPVVAPSEANKNGKKDDKPPKVKVGK